MTDAQTQVPIEIIFIVREDEVDGGYNASSIGLGYGIHTQGDDWDDLRANVREAVDVSFDDAGPKIILLHFVRDEILVRYAE